MKIINILLHNAVLLSAAAFIFTIGTLPAEAQVMASSKVAAISSDKFSDPKTGIARLRRALANLDTEFAPRQAELTRMAAQLQKLQSELKDPNGNPAVMSKKYDEAEKLNRDIRSKQEDGKASYESRQRTLVDPIYSDLMIALESYAKTRGIDMIVDLSKSGNIFLVNGAIDISAAFIADYNTKNPAAQ